MPPTIDAARSTHLKILGAFALIYIVWGSTFLTIRYAVETIPPLLMTGLRSLGAGALLYAVLINRHEPPTLRQWFKAAIGGFFYFALCNGLLAWAQTRVPSGIAAVILALIPAAIVLCDWWHPQGTRPPWLVITGIVLSFVGVIVLVEPYKLQATDMIDRGATAALMLAAFAWGLGSILTRYAPPHKSPFMTSAMQLITGGLLLLATTVFSNDWSVMLGHGFVWKSWLSLLYLIVIGSMLTFSAYVWLLQRVAPSKVATYAYVNPVVAVLLGWLFANEAITLHIILSMAIVVAGVVLVITFQRRA